MADALDVVRRQPGPGELRVGPDQLGQLWVVLEEEHVVAGVASAELQEEVPWRAGIDVDKVAAGVVHLESVGIDVRQQRHTTFASQLKLSLFVGLTRLRRVDRADQRVHSESSCLGGRGYHGKSQRRSRKT